MFYMTRQETPLYKQLLAVVMIFSVLLTFTPRETEGVIFLSALFQGLLSQYTFTQFISDLIIVCVLGACGGDNGGGNECNVGGSCPYNICGQTITGTWQLAEDENGKEVCTCAAPPDTTIVACGITPLGTPPLWTVPPIVRLGDSVDIYWDIGANDPTSCVLRGPGIGTVNIADQTNSYISTTAGGPHVYTLTCTANSYQESGSIQLRIAGETTEF